MKKHICLFIIFIFCMSSVCYCQWGSDLEKGEYYFNKGEYAQALPYLQNAAKSGNANAQTLLGNLFENGWGVTKNIQTALNMYNKAIVQKYRPAIIAMGNVYRGNSGIAENKAKAFEYYKMAADLGSAEGFYQLGLCYKNGYFVDKDEVKGFEYFKQAINHGATYQSLITLADCYYNGIGTDINLDEAYNYYARTYNAFKGLNCPECSIFASLAVSQGNYVYAEDILRPYIDECEPAKELYASIKEAAEKQSLYISTNNESYNYYFKDGDLDDSPSGRGKCKKFSKDLYYKIDNSIRYNTKFSITFWIKDFSDGYVIRVMSINATNTVLDYPSIQIVNDKLAFRIWDPDKGNTFNSSLTKLHDNKWHFITVTFNGSMKRLYIDGKFEGIEDNVQKKQSNGSAIYVGGGIDMKFANLRLFPGTVLKENQIKVLYEMESQGL